MRRASGVIVVMTQPDKALSPSLADDSQVLDDSDALWTRLRGLAGQSEEAPRLADAFSIARRAHAEQWRKTAVGAARVPYIVHPLRVALIIADEWEQRDIATLSTCLLHDVLEDCPWDDRDTWERQIAECCGNDVRQAVNTLSKPAPGPAEVKASRDARYFAELFRAPQWVRLVKCADRVDNLRDAARWGNQDFWKRYSSETIGWHLYLARETAPIAEVGIFKELVKGERELHGRVPIWADGRMIDPVAAALIPEHVARLHGVIGLAIQGEMLIVGLADTGNATALDAVRRILPHSPAQSYTVRPLKLSSEAISDALAAQMYGQI